MCTIKLEPLKVLSLTIKNILRELPQLGLQKYFRRKWSFLRLFIYSVTYPTIYIQNMCPSLRMTLNSFLKQKKVVELVWPLLGLQALHSRTKWGRSLILAILMLLMFYLIYTDVGTTFQEKNIDSEGFFYFFS